MNTQKKLLFCLLVSGQLLAMEEKSQALAKSDDRHAAAESQTSFWGPVGQALGADGFSVDWFDGAADRPHDEADRERMANLSQYDSIAMLQSLFGIEKYVAFARCVGCHQRPWGEIPEKIKASDARDRHNRQTMDFYIKALCFWKKMYECGDPAVEGAAALAILRGYIRGLGVIVGNPNFTDENLKELKHRFEVAAQAIASALEEIAKEEKARK